MRIKKIAFGNASEAFIESRLEERINIIYSDENNKGKTLVIQGLMYCLGNEPIFPAGFEYKKYHFYVQFTVEDNTFEIVRRNSSFIIKTSGGMQICNSVSELKYFFDENICRLPRMLKDGHERLVDPALFFEIFFIGQDKRDTSSIFNKGFYKNDDFISMLFAMGEPAQQSLSASYLEQIKDQIKIKRQRVVMLKRSSAKIKVDPEIAAIALADSGSNSFEERKKHLVDIYADLTKLQKQRTRELNRAQKLESLIAELNSLNRNLEEGLVVCADCGSERVIYKSKDLEFEVSNKSVKDSIMGSIKNSIALKKKIIYDLGMQVESIQNQLTQEINKSPPSFREFILFSEGLGEAKKFDEEIAKLLAEIGAFMQLLERGTIVSDKERERQLQALSEILSRVSYYYHEIDKNGRLEFSSLFTKKDETYSGSEGQEFYFCKALALRDYLNHPFPIVIDSFRDGEISTAKEEVMLKLLSEIENQVILTSTLKSEEYIREKYKRTDNINPIDYSPHRDSAILEPKYSAAFKQLLSELNIRTLP